MSSPTIKFIKSASVSVTNGSKIVTLTGSVDTYHVYSGTAIFIGSNQPVEGFSGTTVDGSGNSTITLKDTWTLPTVSDEPLVAFNSNEGLPEAIRRARSIGNLTLTLMTNFETLLNSTSSSVSIDIDGVPTSFVPYKYLENEFESKITELNNLTGSINATTKAEFDRARFNELNNFSVSGVVNVDFDSGYEFQQINGWQNKFTIKAGKAMIDGIWHKYSSTEIMLPDAPDGLDKKDLSGRFNDLAEATVAGGDELSQSYLDQRCIVYAVQKDTEAPFGSSGTYIQDADNNIYSNDGVLRQRTFEFFSERLLESVSIEGADSYQSTINAMTSLGWSQDSDVLGQFKKGDDIAIVFTIVQRRNQGAYHPSYNPEGVAYATDGVDLSNRGFWTDSAAAITSKQEAFSNACVAANANGSLISSTSSGGRFPRPDGKFYDAIYASDVKDLRMSSKKLPLKEIREKYKRMAIAGEVRGFEGVPLITKARLSDYLLGDDAINYLSEGKFTLIHNGEDHLRLSSPSQVSALDGLSWIFVKGGVIYRNYAWNNQYHTRIFKWSGGSWGVSTIAELQGEFLAIPYAAPSSGTGLLKSGAVDGAWGYKYKGQLSGAIISNHQQANPTWTDIIGDPANIAATFPDGVEGQWIPFIPDGGSKNFSLNRKSLGNNETYTLTDDNGVTWLNNVLAVNNTNNTYTSSTPESRVQLLHYETQAHFTQDDVNSEVLDFGGIYASGNNGVNDGAILVSGLVNGAPTTFDARASINQEISQYRIITGFLYTTPDNPPSHSDINLGVNLASKSVKTLDYLSHDNNVAKLCYAYKEMVFDVTWGDNNQFEIADNQNTLTDDNGNSVLYGTASFDTQYFIAEE